MLSACLPFFLPFILDFNVDILVGGVIPLVAPEKTRGVPRYRQACAIPLGSYLFTDVRKQSTITAACQRDWKPRARGRSSAYDGVL